MEENQLLQSIDELKAIGKHRAITLALESAIDNRWWHTAYGIAGGFVNDKGRGLDSPTYKVLLKLHTKLNDILIGRGA